MNLHEFQSKRLFAGYKIPVPHGIAVETADEARDAANEMDGGRWVVKAQAHTGGRGKAGGVVVATSVDEVANEARRMLSNPSVADATISSPKVAWRRSIRQSIGCRVCRFHIRVTCSVVCRPWIVSSFPWRRDFLGEVL